MSSLILPTGAAPTNLRLRSSVTTTFVENDVYDICKRMREVSDRLYAVQLEEGGRHAFAIMEHCDDGVERLVFKTKELDARVIEKLQRLMSMPFDVRVRECEKAEYEADALRKENELEDLYERVGRPMWTELERCNFITRPVSYPKTGVTGGKGSLRRDGNAG